MPAAATLSASASFKDSSDSEDNSNLPRKGGKGKLAAGKGLGKGMEKGKEELQKGSTHAYPRFPLEEAFLKALLDHCRDHLHLGMSDNVARETVVDVSKYLKFAALRCGSGGQLEPQHLFDECAIYAYLKQVEEDGVQCAGQLTKLSRIQTALTFAVRHLKWRHNPDIKATVDDAQDNISDWKKALQKEKTSSAKGHLPDLSEKIEKLGDYANLLHNVELHKRVARALQGPNPPSPEDFNLVRTYIALHLFLTCAQRKSTVENMTVTEFEQATRVEGGEKGDHWVVSVHHHKTAATNGPANLVVDDHLYSVMQGYLEYRRGKGTERRFLVKAFGESSKRLPDLVRRLGESFGVSLPTPTLHRQVMGTKASELPQGEQEKVASLMSHSLDTQTRYYRALKTKKASVDAFKVIGSIIHPPPTPPPSVIPLNQPKRMYFTEDQKREIEAFFQGFISTGSAAPLSECKRFLSLHSMEGRTAKNIQDRVKHLNRKK